MNRGTSRTRRSNPKTSAFRQLGVLSSGGHGFLKAVDTNAKMNHAKASANINRQKLAVGFSGLAETDVEWLVS